MTRCRRDRTRAANGIALTFGMALLVGITQSVMGQVSFQQLREPNTDISFNAMSVAAPGTIVLAGEQVFENEKGVVSVSSDRGKTWALVKGLTRGRLLGVTMVDGMNGWAVGEGGAVVATTDGGKKWTSQTSKVLVDLYDVFFLNPRKGWAVGANSTVVTTSDGGRTWQVLAGGQPSGQVGEGEVMLMGVSFISETVGFAAGAGETGVIRSTTDGGKTWKVVHTTEDGLFDISFSSPRQGWAVGKFGTVIMTSDGGATWKAQPGGSEEDLIGVEAGDDKNVWASGEYGAIAYTTNGGTKWNSVSVPVTIGGKSKPLTAKVSDIAAIKNEAWAMTDFGRVIYFVAK